MGLTDTALLASIDQTLASMRAALVAATDPEQTDEARARLAADAGANLALLPGRAAAGDWPGVPEAVFGAIDRAKEAARAGDLDGSHRELTAARESIGGPSA